MRSVSIIANKSDSTIQSGVYQATKSGSLSRHVVGATISASLGTTSLGFVLGFASPVQSSMKKQLEWSDDDFGWFGSCNFIGCILGSFGGVYCIEKFGRKFNMMLSSLLFVTGWIMITFTRGTMLAFAGRCITGIGSGIVAFTVPLYIAEISPAKYRGLLASTSPIGLSFGILIGFCFGAVLSWRWLAITGALPAVVMSTLMLFYPETPRWLVKNEKIAEARSVLVFLRKSSPDQCEAELNEIRESLHSYEKFSLAEFLNPEIYRPFMIVIGMFISLQLIGINAIGTYISRILMHANFQNANLIEILSVAVGFVGTMFSGILVDKFGRRKLLVICGSIVCVSMLLLGVSNYFTDLNNSLAIISLCSYFFGVDGGIMPCVYLLLGELLPNRIRGVAGGIAIQVNYFSAFLMVKLYIPMENSLGPYGCYWFYAAVSLFSIVFVYIVLPETKGKTLEEIEKIFMRKERNAFERNSNMNYGTSTYVTNDKTPLTTH